MECKHLQDAVDISPGFVRRLVEDNRNMWVCAGNLLIFLNHFILFYVLFMYYLLFIIYF